jgi:flagellar assembly factor FliW
MGRKIIMKIYSTRFGEIEIDDKEIVNFEEGILGFEEMTKYVVLNIEENNPLMLMQSIEEPALAFVIINPYEFRSEYLIELSDDEVKKLKIEKEEDVDIFAIVVIPHENPSKMTANLQGPLIINRNKKIGKQIITNNSEYGIKHNILKEMEKKSGGAE